MVPQNTVYVLLPRSRDKIPDVMHSERREEPSINIGDQNVDPTSADRRLAERCSRMHLYEYTVL